MPASFDEEARELTVMAARDAGLEKLTLLEEPAAAFYSWIANNLAASRKKLFDGQIVLVCDVGGGTSDFSLIRVSREGDLVNFTRTAVGKHLLLGGDNLDLTLAWLVESKLGVPLSIRQRSGLRRQCSAAKEKLLNDPNLKSVEITVLGTGSSLIGKSLKTEILREEALELALEGFLPISERGELPKDEKRSLFRELGLPYVSDPAVTRHLNEFLEPTGQVPDAILFNGGFFIPEILRERVADVVGHWYGTPSRDLREHRSRPGRGARRGLLLLRALHRQRRAGARRPAAHLLHRARRSRARANFPPSAWCRAAPKRARPSKSITTRCNWSPTGPSPSASTVRSRAPTTSSGRCWNSTRATPDLHMHAPLNAVIRFGKKAEERLIPVKLGARLTEIGTLETWCESKISDNRWRLQFELRKQAAAKRRRSARPRRWSANRR